MKLFQFLVFTFLVSLLFIVNANPFMNCQTDSFGNKTCQGSNGKSWFGRKDLSGNVLWIDNQRNTIREEKDSFGNTTYRDSSGALRGRKDTYGNITWYDKNGNTLTGRTDSFGNTNYKDRSGKLINCYEDSFGNETCGQ